MSGPARAASLVDAFLSALARSNVAAHRMNVAAKNLDELLEQDPESQRVLYQERLANREASYTESLHVLGLSIRAVVA